VIGFPDDALAPKPRLPDGWRRFPHPPAAQAVGDAFLDGGTQLALRLPSALVPKEHIYLLNPHHPRRSEIRVLEIEPFNLDGRFFQGA